MGDSIGFKFMNLLSYVNLPKWQDKLPLLTSLDTIELAFDDVKVNQWMRQNWHVSIYVSLIYVVCIFLIGKYMTDKRPFDLRKPLFLWSLSLSLFSLIAFLRISDYIFEQPLKVGWTAALCDVTYYKGVRGKKLYAFLFPLSKLPELIDTSFIVLRKTPLSFLHWYHHITVFVYCWYSYAHPTSSGLWFGFMNYIVHFVMYSYYAVRANGHIPIPKIVNKCVTILQLFQMVLGVIFNTITIRAFLKGVTCGTDSFKIQISILIYVSYGALFANFFYQTYLKPKPKLELKNGSNSK
ncbi:hypothetical protein LOD99_10687 [Oopsacas minuta]|uniref:Elongation of very long chain fatty acids protein n=1 Tax=Oopsacas minuta TaxID=111878 RepID=A0AAV7KGR3_9METZ|nr:hypothetical protein LOD99_10687 [Oopsacas minuta]